MDTPATPATTPIPVAAKPAAPAATPAAQPDAKPAAPAQERVFEVKVAGEMKKFTESEAKKLLSKAGYADKVVSQAKEALATLKKIQEERAKEAEELEKDEEAWLRAKGRDPEALARKIVERKLAEQGMTPEQREAAELRAQLAEKDKRLKEVEAAKESETLTKRQAAFQAQMESVLAEAAEAAGIPRDGDGFYAIYEALRDWKRAGLPFDAERIVEKAKENLDSVPKRIQEAVLKGTKGKALVELLGKDVVAEVLRYKLEELRGGGSSAAAPQKPVDQEKTEGEYISTQEAERRRLERLKKFQVKR